MTFISSPLQTHYHNPPTLSKHKYRPGRRHSIFNDINTKSTQLCSHINNEILTHQHSIPPTFLMASIDVSTISSQTGVTTVFEPTMPDPIALAGMGSIVVLCVIAGLVWANGVVPVSRTKLAISKNRGEVKEYLDGLREDTSITSDDVSSITTGDSTNNDGRNFERWLFSDWLNKSPVKKDAAIPFLKQAKWNSGDNPVLVASGLIGVCVIIASITERVGI